MIPLLICLLSDEQCMLFFNDVLIIQSDVIFWGCRQERKPRNRSEKLSELANRVYNEQTSKPECDPYF
jgi:hypothetical protein